jgi:hypothetical protein
MEFSLSHKGTVSECREVLNDAVAQLKPPFKEEHAVIRAICHYIVAENLDPLYAPWVETHNILRAARAGTLPKEPETEFSVDLVINVKELARKE